MPAFFGSDGSYFLQFLVLFLVILILLMGAALLFRRLAGRGLSLSARSGQRTRQPRLGIVDIYELDRQRQLILLRRDNVEHLLLVGGPNDVVVERNVVRSAGARLPTDGVIRPESARELPAPGPGALPEPAASDPGFEMPVVVPPPLPGSHAAPAGRTPPLDPSLFEPEPESSEAPPHTEPVRSRVGIAQVGRILRRSPPPFAEPPPDAAQDDRRQTQAPAGSPTPGPPRQETGAPPTMAGEEPRPVDPAVLSDMARELETALRRPASAVTPPPFTPAPPPAAEPAPSAPVAAPGSEPAPPPAAPAPQRRPDPVAAGMAASQVLSPAPMAASARPAPEPPKAAPRSRATPSMPPMPVPSAPQADAGEAANGKEAAKDVGGPAPAASSSPPAQTPATRPAPAEAKPAAQPAQPPTLEEIETEFARLLGRQVNGKG